MSTELPTNPQNRNEQFLNAIADSSAELPANPQNRREKYLNAIAQKDASLAPAHAYNREEQYLAYIAEHPGSGGETETKTVTITSNGTTEVTPTAGKTMTKVTVQTNVPVPTLEASKEVTYTENGTFTIEPSEGKDAIEEVSVTVNVPNPLLAHTVTFYAAAGTDKLYVISLTDGESISEPPTPVIEGVFGGWWTSPNGGGEKISFPYTPIDDIALYCYDITTLANTRWQFIGNAVNPQKLYADFSVDFEIVTPQRLSSHTFTGLALGINLSSASPYYLTPQASSSSGYVRLNLVLSNTDFVGGSLIARDESGLGHLNEYANQVYPTSGSEQRTFEYLFISGADISNIDLINYINSVFTKINV